MKISLAKRYLTEIKKGCCSFLECNNSKIVRTSKIVDSFYIGLGCYIVETIDYLWIIGENAGFGNQHPQLGASYIIETPVGTKKIPPITSICIITSETLNIRKIKSGDCVYIVVVL